MNKIMEYMFFGLPIAAFDLAEAKVSAGDAADYAGEMSDRALAATIEGLLSDPARRREMAAYGESRLRDQLAWEHSEPHLLAAYEKVFEG